jgi:hypothetical protein
MPDAALTVRVAALRTVYGGAQQSDLCEAS